MKNISKQYVEKDVNLVYKFQKNLDLHPSKDINKFERVLELQPLKHLRT